MDYPLVIDGKADGRLRVEAQGLYTYMEAVTEKQRELLRIWVQGKGQEQYLGLMQPYEGGMRLCRRLTRREMEMFPRTIERAADRPLDKATGDRLWERQGDGSLVCRAEGMIALPCELGRVHYGARLMLIEDRQYMVFTY